MELATIHVSGVNAKVVQKAPVPVNIIGGYVDVIFDDDWDGLVRTAVIHGAKDLDVVNVGNRFEIPQEAVSESGIRLKVGFYGVSQDGGRGIPTLWADLGVIQEAADPSGDESTDPALPVWAQLQALIGDLDNLNTDAKETIVAAINEALTKGGADPAEVARLVEEYLEQNPITADQIGAVGKEELPTAINEALAQAKASGEFKGESGQPGKDGQDGKDYVLTPADKTEIAEMAAELVDVPEGSGGSGTLLPETEISQQGRVYGFDFNSIPIGAKVAVIIDGIPYVATHNPIGDGSDTWSYIGNIALFSPDGAGTEYDTGEPFVVFMYNGFSDFFFADGASHKVAICTVDVLDEVYVRALNSIGNMSGGSGSFVVNVTVDEALTVTSADKTYEEINGALESGMSVVAVAGDLNFPYAGLNVDNGSILFAFNGGTQGGAELILILAVTLENVWSMTVKDFITAENIGMKYVSSNTFNAFTKGAAKVQTATVGQTIKVKSVDDNGVPTAWEAIEFPKTEEAWDILMNATAEEDIFAFEATTPPDGHTFDEYTEIVITLFLRPNSGDFTSGIHATFDGIGWNGKPGIDLGITGIKDTTVAGQLYMARVERTSFGWIPVFFGKSYNMTNMNAGVSPMANGIWNAVGAVFGGTNIPENIETVWWNEPITAIKVGGWQAVLGAGSKAIVYGKRSS